MTLTDLPRLYDLSRNDLNRRRIRPLKNTPKCRSSAVLHRLPLAAAPVYRGGYDIIINRQVFGVRRARKIKENVTTRLGTLAHKILEVYFMQYIITLNEPVVYIAFKKKLQLNSCLDARRRCVVVQRDFCFLFSN